MNEWDVFVRDDDVVSCGCDGNEPRAYVCVQLEVLKRHAHL